MVLGWLALCPSIKENVNMSIKTDVLWTMSQRYQKAALDTDDFDQAELYTIKACRYYEMWEKAVEGSVTFMDFEMDSTDEEEAA